MKSKLSILIAVFAVFLFSYAISGTQIANSQTASGQGSIPKDFPQSPDGEQFNLAMANVSVENITNNKSSYNAGEEITGEFTIGNYSPVNLEGLNYRVLIGSNYEGDEDSKFSSTFLDASNLVSIGELKSGETKKISYRYKIPSYVDGKKLAVQIDVYNSSDGTIGENSGKFISITKSAVSVEVSGDKIVMSDGKEYTLGRGPTIYKDKEPKAASVHLNVKNISKASVAVSASVKVYNQSDKNSTKSFDVNLATLKASESKEVAIDLPNMDYASGVYFAEILLKDSQGNQLASRLGARYIVGGDMVTVHSVQADKPEVREGETFNLSYIISGRPMDVANAVDYTKIPNLPKTNDGQSTGIKKEGMISFDVFNELGNQIAAYSEPFALYDSNSGEIALTADRNAKAMKAVITVYDKNGTDFFTKEVYLRPDYEEIAKQEIQKRRMIQLGEIILLVLIVITVAVMVRRKRMGMHGLNMLILLVIVSIPAVADAWIWTGTPFNCSMEDTTGSPSVSVYQPVDYRHYPEGSQIKLYGSATALACGNSGLTLTMYFYNNADGAYGTRVFLNQGATGVHSYWYTSATFMSRYFSVGSRPGFYRVQFYVSDGCHVVNGYVPYYVDCAAGRAVGSSGYCENIVNGACGPLNGQTFASAQTGASASQYCSSGTHSTDGFVGNIHTWQCVGSAGGTTASCQYAENTSTTTNTTNAMCGTLNNQNIISGQSTSGYTYCFNSTPSSETVSGNMHSWTCTSTANGGSSASCQYISIPCTNGSCVATTTNNNAGTAMCGTKNGSPVTSGSSINSNSSGLCGTGSSVSGSISFNYLNNEWRWTCGAGSSSSLCKASCTTGTSFCPSTGVCSSSCNDWCPNIEGNQTNKSAYVIDASGQCTDANLITNFNLSPSITNSQGVCKAFWTTTNPTTDNMTCKINGTTVACANAVGYNIQPGVVRFEAFTSTTTGDGTSATSTVITDAEELRCTKNPSLIEI